MYKVFFKESSFLLTDTCNIPKNGILYWKHQNFNDTKLFIIKLLEKNEPFQAILVHDDIEELFSIFKSCFLYVKAAGGVVRQKENILIIKRLGVYDLPKGHLETGESIEECAMREVEEECGIRNVRITAPLAQTLHLYNRHENWYLKKTYWYEMTAPLPQQLTPQTEEDIEEALWLPLSGISTVLPLTYPSLCPVFEQIKERYEKS